MPPLYQATCKYCTPYQKVETYIPRKKTVWPHPQGLHLCIWSGLYIPMVDLIWNLYFPVLLERSSGWRQFPALPSAPAVEPRVHINVQYTNFQFGKITDHEWKQLILVVNFLFGWRVNKIPNRHFYWILPGPSFAM